MESFTRELTPEEEARIINRISEEVVKRRMETVAIMFLGSIKPISNIGSQLALAFVAPFLSLFTDAGVDYIKFFDRQERVEKLLQKIEEETKLRTDEEKRNREQEKIISKTFGLRLSLLPGFSIREEATRGESSSGIVAIQRKESEGGGFLSVSFDTLESAPQSFPYDASAHIHRESVRQALMLSQDMALRESERGRDSKIRGHRTSVTTYEWNDQTGAR
jgi:hypothetical protein